MDPVFRDTELKLKNGWLCLATSKVQMKWVWFFAAGSTCFRLDPDFHLRTDLKVYIVSVFIFQSVVDPHFSIQKIGTFDSDLCSVWFIWNRRFDDCFHRSGKSDTWFVAHCLLKLLVI